MSAAPVSTRPSSALPSSFFAEAQLTDPVEDLRAHTNRCVLSRTLQLASQHRWVAEWLFSDPDAKFHGNIALPLSTFDKGYAVSVMHIFQHATHSRHLASNLLLLPVASIGSVTVGYTVSQGRTGQLNTGRYAFDSRVDEVVLVLHSYTPQATALMAIAPGSDDAYQYLVLCPNGHYSFNNLPNQAISVQVGKRQGNSFSASLLNSQPHQPNHLQSLPDSVEELLKIPVPFDTERSSGEETDLLLAAEIDLPSQLPWIIDESSRPADNVGIPATPGNADTSSGAFNFDALSESIHDIERAICGRFSTSESAHMSFTKDFELPQRTVVDISTASAFDANLLRRRAVTEYFAATAPVVTDERYLPFVLPSNPQALLPMPQEDQPMGHSATRPTTIAPKPLPVSNTDRQTMQSNTAAQQARERMLEARRRRNRMSAARSNERRKQNWNRSMQTLNSLKKRVHELETRRAQLVEENDVLRHIISNRTNALFNTSSAESNNEGRFLN
ncbi:hypothetical protein BWQ96_02583 [Gracilariopsis chorda]|uniref:BZIP domain-containing protein n=1 Tax=Gracilariopsis chorda TaxID=448386 RepID=A0A2V3IZN0_9FLOR|nr:hypothetical protein BWQ96_02583 [Gracilariopsis chorda]|eukprot:PXF47604.1 hypothetical protein BWQ96_02583 [Gracilariopsis chorda]